MKGPHVKPSSLMIAGILFCGVVGAQDGPPLTPKSLQAALSAKPAGAEAERLAERVRSYFGGRESVLKGAAPKVDELTVAWAVEAAALPANAAAPRVVADVGAFSLTLTPLGATGVYAGVATLSHGHAMTWHYEVGDRRVGGGQLEVY